MHKSRGVSQYLKNHARNDCPLPCATFAKLQMIIHNSPLECVCRLFKTSLQRWHKSMYVWSRYTCVSARCQFDERQVWRDFAIKFSNREISEKCWNPTPLQIMAECMLYVRSGWGETPWQCIKGSVWSWNDHGTPENKQESNGVIDRIN